MAGVQCDRGKDFVPGPRSAEPRNRRRLAIYLNSILINGAIYLVCLPLLAMMASFFRSHFDTDWRAFKLTALLQLAFALTVPYLLFADVPLGHAIGAPIIATVLLGVSAFLIGAFGLLAFPVVFCLLHRPANWKLWLERIFAGYFAIPVLLVVVVELEKRIADRPGGQSVNDASMPPEFNVVLYGQILEVDGQPSGGAFVALDGCESYDRKMLQADDAGIFRVRAHCANSLLISQVSSFSHALACVRDDDSAQPGGPLARFVVDGFHVTGKDESYWGGFSREKPYRIACSWNRTLRDEQMQLSKKLQASAMPPPKSNSTVTEVPTAQVKNSQLYLEAHWFATPLIADGRLYTMQLESSIPAQFGFVEGDQPGWLQLRYQQVGKIDPANGRRANGYLVLSAIEDGGFHPVGDFDAGDLPVDKYRKMIKVELDGNAAEQVVAYNFLADQGRVEGKLEITHSVASRNQVLRFKVNASRDIRYSRN